MQPNPKATLLMKGLRSRVSRGLAARSNWEDEWGGGDLRGGRNPAEIERVRRKKISQRLKFEK